MQTKHAAIVISAAILIAAYLLSGRSLFGPNNYEDCVLESMEGIVSNHAAISIRDACKQKFSSGTEQSAITRLLSDVSSWFSKQEIPPPPPGYVLDSE